MADTDASASEQQKKSRGRPKKSEPRNETKDSSPDEPKAKRGRGRPKGAVKKPGRKAASSPAKSGKRGRGRPRKNDVGDSKNAAEKSGDESDNAESDE